MTELCPDCKRPIWDGSAPPDESSCVYATDAFTTYDDELQCAGLTITRLRLELTNALSIANSRTYCMDSPEVLKARIGELEKELAESERSRQHTEQWYTERHETLFHWAHEDIEHRGGYFPIVANGTESPFRPPTYAQQLNAARHRAEKAERELAEARSIGELEQAVVPMGPWPIWPPENRCEATNPNHFDWRCCLDAGHEGQHQGAAGSKLNAIKWPNDGGK